MYLSDVSIRRPVLAWVLTLVILIVGAVGYNRLAVQELPDIDFPIVTISVFWRGAAPDVLETEVTDVIEEEINTIEGIRTVVSQTREERTQITVQFDLERDVDIAAQDVRDTISRIRRRLPSDIEEPVVRKLDLDAQPIMVVSISSDWMSRIELGEYADRVIKERLQLLPGVGSVLLGGYREFAVRVDLCAERLASRQLTVLDVVRALQRENIELPSGRIESTHREFVVRTHGRFPTPEAFEDLVITTRAGTPIRLRDVADVRRGTENERTVARVRGRPSVGLRILRQSQANTLDVARRVNEELEILRPELPPGVDFAIPFDSSVFIQDSVDSTMNTLFLAGVMVVIVMFVFLRSVRSSFIPAIVIPVAVIGTFAIMYMLNFSINILTLLGLILAIGLLVDDAIVMLENIYRHIEKEQEDRIQAAQNGASEIAFAVIASSLSLLAVFVPVAFITGIVGQFFFEFGLTVAAAIVISTFIALTLTPMLCSRVLRVRKNHNRVYYALENGFNRLGDGYARVLRVSLNHRAWVVLLAIAAFGAGLFVARFVTREFAPQQDQGTMIALMRAPDGSTLEYTDRYLREVEEIVDAIPEVRSFFAAIGMMGGETHRALMFISLLDHRDRDRDQFEIMREIRRKTAEVPGLSVFLTERPIVGGPGVDAKPLQYVIQHPDMEVLAHGSEEIVRRLRETPGFEDVDSDLDISKPELHIRIDRDRASDLGVSARDVSETLQILLGGMEVTDYKEGDRQYDVIVQLCELNRATPRDLENIYVRGNPGLLVPITNLVRFEESVGPSQINHFDRVRSVTIGANLEGITLGEALDQVRRIAREVMPADARYDLAGEARELADAFEALAFAFVLSIIIIYLVLAAQFNSWIHPFTIMLGLPLALIGVFGGLWITNQTLNIFSFIGFIMLAGLVTKNGILLIDYTNRKREQGMERLEAVIHAGKVRLRPILMTATTTIIGVTPIALGMGVGGEARAPLGIVVIGGLLVSTILTLVVIPVIYTLLDDIVRKIPNPFSR